MCIFKYIFVLLNRQLLKTIPFLRDQKLNECVNMALRLGPSPYNLKCFRDMSKTLKPFFCSLQTNKLWSPLLLVSSDRSDGSLFAPSDETRIHMVHSSVTRL